MDTFNTQFCPFKASLKYTQSTSQVTEMDKKKKNNIGAPCAEVERKKRKDRESVCDPLWGLSMAATFTALTTNLH